MRLALLAALGGAFGSAARYLMVTAAIEALGTQFPWGTLAVNISGSLAIGALMAAINGWFAGSADLRVLLVTGFLGGFTTFSAFSFEMLQLLERKAFVAAAAYGVGSVLASLMAVTLGYWAVKAMAA